MEPIFSRLSLLLGEDSVASLSSKRVLLFGVGGVGGYVAEALARSGIGSFTLVDNDVVSPSNINRQIIALHSTIGLPKVQVMASRIKDINPDAAVETKEVFVNLDNVASFDFASYDYVIDAIDTVTAKLAIVEACVKAGVPVLSSMGAGNKMDPTKFVVSDISKTDTDPLARVMRRELRSRGINHLKVVYSKETPIKPKSDLPPSAFGKKFVPGSTAFVPSACGLVIASEVVKDLLSL